MYALGVRQLRKMNAARQPGREHNCLSSAALAGEMSILQSALASLETSFGHTQVTQNLTGVYQCILWKRLTTVPNLAVGLGESDCFSLKPSWA